MVTISTQESFRKQVSPDSSVKPQKSCIRIAGEWKGGAAMHCFLWSQEKLFPPLLPPERHAAKPAPHTVSYQPQSFTGTHKQQKSKTKIQSTEQKVPAPGWVRRGKGSSPNLHFCYCFDMCQKMLRKQTTSCSMDIRNSENLSFLTKRHFS